MQSFPPDACYSSLHIDHHGMRSALQANQQLQCYISHARSGHIQSNSVCVSLRSLGRLHVNVQHSGLFSVRSFSTPVSGKYCSARVIFPLHMARMAPHPMKRGAGLGNGNLAAGLCVVSTVCLLLTTLFGYADAAQGLFVFGDSYTDTGENLKYPYGITWPGDGTAHRSSDGRNEVDYIAMKLGVPSPTPWEFLGGGQNGGVNFGVGGSAVTYAFGWKPLDQQVDQFESMVKGGTWTAAHLAQSVALVSIAVNDYTYYNQHGNGAGGVAAFVDTVVDKMGANLQRIHNLGVGSIMVENLVPMGCMPFTTLWVNGETGCVADNLLDTETNLHDEKLQAKVNALNKGGANIMMLDLTKALRRLFENGPAYGFTEAYKRCCTGSCGGGDGYTVCDNPSKHVIFDSIHPTEAAWKAVTNLYTYSQGYTKGVTLHTWFQQNQLNN